MDGVNRSRLVESLKKILKLIHNHNALNTKLQINLII